MTKSIQISLYLIAAAVAVVLVFEFYVSNTNHSAGGAVELSRPNYSALALEGEYAFSENCTTCHGVAARGTDKGPPLVHDIYNPGHHPDASFRRAIAQGTVQHHWSFGNMPAISDVPNETAAKIIVYIRELQFANGIVYREHSM